MTNQEIKDKVEAIASNLGFTPTTILGMYKKSDTYIHMYVEQTITIFPEAETDSFSFEIACEEKTVKIGYHATVEKIVEKIQKELL